MKTIKSKVVALVLIISLTSVGVLGTVSLVGIQSIRTAIIEDIHQLNNRSITDATEAMSIHNQNELISLVETNSSLADLGLSFLLNQTRQVALAAKDLYTDQNRYLQGREVASLPLDAFDFSSNYPSEIIGQFSFHMRAPRSVMNPSSIVEENGVVVGASLDESLLTNEMRRDLYLAQYLKGALGGVRNFAAEDDSFGGILASYFCLESSGIDILADTRTTTMVEYDARERDWYQEASRLQDGQAYWSDLVQDASGRGTALICSMPVFVDGTLIGVAGTGGLIEDLSALVLNTSSAHGGYAFLVNLADDGSVQLLISSDHDPQSDLNRYQQNLLQLENPELDRAFSQLRDGESGLLRLTLDGQESYLAFSPLNITDWAMVSVIAVNDASIAEPIEALRDDLNIIAEQTLQDMSERIVVVVSIFLVFAIIVTFLVIGFSYRLSHALTEPLRNLAEGAQHISKGNLDFKVPVESNDEMAVLGEAFNTMTEDLKAYLEDLAQATAEKERIATELAVARHIQTSMLPCVFPPFPERNEFDIYALMEPAREVGGDFYDFFLVDDDHLGVVIADVSGKGVPAALFMVVARTLIKNYAQLGYRPSEVFEKVNRLLCENNNAELFVTAWMGIVELSSGRLCYVNAGHNPPLIKHEGGTFSYLTHRSGFVLAGMEDSSYEEFDLNMRKGSCLFLYTDGITEAMNGKNQQYGDTRLLEILNNSTSCLITELPPLVRMSVNEFIQDASQNDDITLLVLEIKV